MARMEASGADELEAMLRAVRLDVGGTHGGWGLAGGGRGRRGDELHFEAALGEDEVIDGAVAGLHVGLKAEALGQQEADGVALFEADLVFGELGEPGIGSFVGARYDGVEGVADPVGCAGDRGVEAVGDLDESLDGEVGGLKTAGVRGARDGDVEVGVRRGGEVDGGHVKGERGGEVGLFHDGGLSVEAQGWQEEKKRGEEREMSREDADHGAETPCRP